MNRNEIDTPVNRNANYHSPFTDLTNHVLREQLN